MEKELQREEYKKQMDEKKWIQEHVLDTNIFEGRGRHACLNKGIIQFKKKKHSVCFRTDSCKRLVKHYRVLYFHVRVAVTLARHELLFLSSFASQHRFR